MEVLEQVLYRHQGDHGNLKPFSQFCNCRATGAANFLTIEGSDCQSWSGSGTQQQTVRFA